MEVIIKAEPKEFADLVLAIQNRQEKCNVCAPTDWLAYPVTSDGDVPTGELSTTKCTTANCPQIT